MRAYRDAGLTMGKMWGKIVEQKKTRDLALASMARDDPPASSKDTRRTVDSHDIEKLRAQAYASMPASYIANYIYCNTNF